MADSLKKYREKRNFAVTPEPPDGGESGDAGLAFVIQKHWASHLHYDFRLELDGAMKSWAVPKGPSFDPSVKRMAVQVEDHPIAYNQFEGTIPEGQYGAGKVIIWDEGRWTPIGDPRKGYKAGHLKFTLDGVKLRGRWALIRMKGKESDRQPPWLLIKESDEYARPDQDFSVVDEMPDSVVPLRAKKKAAPARGKPKARGSKEMGAVAALPGKAAPLPASLKPQLATLVEGVPRGAADWSFEMKFDGYRILARIEDGNAKLYTRNSHDWTAKMPRLAQELAALEIANAWIDGEIVVLTREGVPSFQALQNAFDAASTADIVFYAFDLPYVAGRDLRDEPLGLRRDLLRQVMARSKGKHLTFSEAFDKPAADLVASACKLGLEGIIGKRLSAPYVSRRTDDWIKLKCTQRQEFVIVGYTEPKGSRKGFGALLLAVHEPDGALRYAGNVGTGFDDRTLLDLHRRLAGIEQKTSALTQGKSRALKQVHWVRPTLIGEVSFGEWTGDGHVRHSTFRGLRTDKPPKKITREVAMPAAKLSARNSPAKAKEVAAAKPPKGMKLSNPDRVIDPSSGATKLDLARYYGLVAPLMMEHLRGRPVSFVRAPAGIQGEHFFQRHSESPIPGVAALPERLYPGHPSLMEVSNETAILAAAQLNVVEFHTWNALKTSIGKPDRMLFDLDPGEGVDWPAVQQGAELVRVLLQELGLRGWLKTSGGKGLHVVVPIRKQYGWDAVKDFSEAMVRHLAQTLPKLFVAKSGPKNRVGKIFADYLRNGFGATTVAAWSARARPGLGVSVPVRWDELDGLKGSTHWTIANIHTRLDAGNEPWDDYAPQAIGRAMKQLGVEARS
ncbi:DNA ligase D [Achromobacter sp.]|uniref:DNA ligase D n=1 Tax=Achromobacter sp. TaxID=134375 RepID=UPI002F93F4C3